MFIPMMSKGNEKKALISAFGGLNLSEGYTFGEFSDMKNISSDFFPVLSVSAKMNTVQKDAEIKNIKAVIQPEEVQDAVLSFTGVAGENFYYNGVKIPFAYSFMAIPEDEKIQLVSYSDAIIILPCMYIFSYKDKKKNDKLYPLIPGAYDEYITVDTGGAQGSAATITLDTGSVNTWEKLGIFAGDSIVLKTSESGYETLNVYEEENKYDKPEGYKTIASAIVQSATADTLKVMFYDANGRVMDVTDSKAEIINHLFKRSLIIYRKYPKFDRACVYANRLWVTAKNGESIHTSAPGKPKEFMDFSGLSTDSWFTQVGESGPFTGICAFRDGVVAFKKNNIYHIYGDRATNFNISKKFSGCGCADAGSVCETDTAIYFLSSDGVYEYSGGNPENISRKLNLKNCCKGAAFSDGKKYYISVGDEKRIFVYDRAIGLWHIEGEFGLVDGMFFKDRIYLASKDDFYEVSDVYENEWYAVLCDMCESEMEQKGVNELFLRTEIGENSYVEVFFKYNDGEFKLCGRSEEAGEYTFRVPVRFKKGDKYSIKISGKGNALIKAIERSFYSGGGAFSRKG